MIKKMWEQWNQFWFAPQNLLGVAFMRVMLCGTLFYLYSIRMTNISYFTDNSWMPRSEALATVEELYRPLFLWSFWPDSWMGVMHALLVLLLGLLTLGIGGRWLMWMAWILDIGFIQRNYAVTFGADLIASLFLFYLSFTQSCERLSVLNLLRKKKVFQQGDWLSSLMIRMLQVHISVIYAYTGWEKLKGMTWWNGTALWTVMANSQTAIANFEFLRHTPCIISFISFSTIIFEIYFPAMVAWKKTRHLWLCLGVLFHLGISVFMGLGAFAMVMISSYFLFMDPFILEQKTVSRWDFSKN